MAALDRIQIAAIGDTAGDLAEQALAAEAAGIDCVWTPELFRSSVTQATWLAAKTEKVGIATGIAWAFTRSAFILAVTALDIDEMSGGRFRLGLGAGVKRLNETWHDVEYGRPAPHLRETIEATRQIMSQAASGEPIRFEGEYVEIDIKGWVRPHKAARERVPIYTAAMQEGMCRMAGDVADGLIGHPMCPPRWVDEVVVPSMETGLKRSGRSRGDIDFLPTVCCAIDDDEARAMEAGRRTIAFYATVRTYRPIWEMHGFADAAAEAGEAFRRGDLEAVPKAIPDEMVDAFAACGPLDKVRARVEDVASRGDGVWLTPATYFIPPSRSGSTSSGSSRRSAQARHNRAAGRENRQREGSARAARRQWPRRGRICPLTTTVPPNRRRNLPPAAAFPVPRPRRCAPARLSPPSRESRGRGPGGSGRASGPRACGSSGGSRRRRR